jgi:asparagine synthase (glutamine-hydrolysing)
MCGIAGRVNQHEPVDRAELFRMTELLAHRGPDDSGYHLRARVGLGHRRLSIVDLAGGRQPLSNEDDTVWIVFNGEIYNHLELRAQLLARGHRFKTRSDTEVIVHAYEEWGGECATRLRGMFAFAIWDETSQTLTLVRDRLGIKPLYFAAFGGDLVFASEIKSIVAARGVDVAIDDEALAAYLALRYVPAPKTLFRGIWKLPPATLLTWRRGLIAQRQYWELTDVVPNDAATTAEAALELRDLIDRATELRLMSEVPVGAFLSGGLDSTVITEAMLRAGRRRGPLKTFSVGYDGLGTAADDELAAARAAAAALGTDHVEVRVTSAEAAAALPKIVWHLDEPVADPACVPLYFLARRAKEDVTVVLSGEGADEILAGYAIYRHVGAAERVRKLGGGLAEVAATLGMMLPSPRMRRAARLLELPLELGYRGVSRAFDDDARAELCHGAALPPPYALLAPHWAPTRGMSALRRMLYLDTRVWLPDDLLVKADKMTMAHAIELRVPFLDHKLVELAWSLPDRMKLDGVVGKALLRRAVRGRVPDAVLDRPKQGFATPAGAWLRTSLRDTARAALLDRGSLARERFDMSLIERLLTQHDAGQDRAAELWPLLVLELWRAEFATATRARASADVETVYAAS